MHDIDAMKKDLVESVRHSKKMQKTQDEYRKRVSKPQQKVDDLEAKVNKLTKTQPWSKAKTPEEALKLKKEYIALCDELDEEKEFLDAILTAIGNTQNDVIKAMSKCAKDAERIAKSIPLNQADKIRKKLVTALEEYYWYQIGIVGPQHAHEKSLYEIGRIVRDPNFCQKQVSRFVSEKNKILAEAESKIKTGK